MQIAKAVLALQRVRARRVERVKRIHHVVIFVLSAHGTVTKPLRGLVAVTLVRAAAIGKMRKRRGTTFCALPARGKVWTVVQRAAAMRANVNKFVIIPRFCFHTSAAAPRGINCAGVRGVLLIFGVTSARQMPADNFGNRMNV